jgi:hypothetical protein
MLGLTTVAVGLLFLAFLLVYLLQMIEFLSRNG